jgi:hypothetical protein
VLVSRESRLDREGHALHCDQGRPSPCLMATPKRDSETFDEHTIAESLGDRK